MKNKNIVLLGLDFNSENFGCSALAYSFLNLLDNIAKNNDMYLNIVSVNYNEFSIKKENLIVESLKIYYKKITFYKKFYKLVKESDLVFDFTGGDSFTDIYGVSRFFKESLLKQIVINKKKKLVIGPQTIGPFNNSFINKWAKRILENSYKVYTRDSLSRKLAENMGIELMQTTDVAFMLPEDADYEVNISKDNKTRVAINVSGLLWNGGYTGKNEFKLKLNYKSFIKKLIEYLLENNYEVHLVGHVFSKDSREDDYHNIQQINSLYPDTVLAPKFKNPMEAKKYFKYMNFFIGSRMHATVGAFSMGVPTVSVAYSRKFSGLYNSINYPYVVDGKEIDTDEAYNLIVKWLNERDTLSKNVNESMKLINEYTEKFTKDIEKIILEEK